MKTNPKDTPIATTFVNAPSGPMVGAQLGRVIAVGSDGAPLVDFPGCASGATPARVGLPCPGIPPAETPGRAVILVFEAGDTARPMIVGWPEPQPALLPETGDKRIYLEGDTVVVEGSRRLELRCGKASLVLTQDGKILLRGENVLNEAKQLNKIRGAAVRIN